MNGTGYLTERWLQRSFTPKPIHVVKPKEWRYPTAEAHGQPMNSDSSPPHCPLMVRADRFRPSLWCQCAVGSAGAGSGSSFFFLSENFWTKT